MVKDPVCGMEIDEHAAKTKSEHKSSTFYFCSPGCKEKFDQSADRYARQTV